MATRRLIFALELCAGSVLHFVYQSTHERSFCLRLYRGSGGPDEYHQDDFPDEVTNAYLLARVKREWPADAVPHTEHGFWHGRIAALNREVLGHAGDPNAPLLLPFRYPVRSGTPVATLAERGADTRVSDYPLLDAAVLRSLPKARKAKDLDRIYTSRNSEDWVTWNVTRLWQRVGVEAWWRALLGEARRRNPDLQLDYDPEDLPSLIPWVTVSSPSSYEHASRLRMRESGIPTLEERAAQPGAVEGDSEIDLVLEGRHYLIFAEAKLHSDISLRTTYDPDRNQIVRNIDCLLDRAGSRAPLFWMLVRDPAEDRWFKRVLQEYRENPERLYQALPHRPERLLDRVLRNLVVLPWEALLRPVLAADFGPEEQSVLQEVRDRVTRERSR